ncbi:MAG: TlpA family protein disulfide reductase [Egibacteraceae bacterium]
MRRFVLSAVLLASVWACGRDAPEGALPERRPEDTFSVAKPREDLPAERRLERAPGDPAGEALDFTLPRLGGGEVTGASLAGRDAVLWFWTPSCEPCNAEAPEVARVARQHSGEVAFVGIPSKDVVPAMEAFVSRHGLEDMPQAIDLEGVVWRHFGLPDQPAWAFIDGQTGEVELVLGEMGADRLTNAIDQLAG